MPEHRNALALIRSTSRKLLKSRRNLHLIDRQREGIEGINVLEQQATGK